MQKRLSDARVAKLLALAVAAVLVLMPFHAILTVWLSQAVGHYVLLRLWKEMVLVLLGLGAGYLLCRDRALRTRFAGLLLARVVAVYLLLQVGWGLAALAVRHVTLEALGYGWVADTRFLVFFLAVWVIAVKAPELSTWWPKLVLWPAAAVCVFGLLQFFVLPYDFLTHLGYSASTIFPYEDINHNIHYLRIMSTLRGANPLGAYLTVIICLLLVLLWQGYARRWWGGERLLPAVVAALLLACLGVLFLTYSRSAWLGLLAAVAVLVWVAWPKARIDAVRAVLWAAVPVITLVVFLSSNVTFQNIFFHTQAHSAVATTSNEGHVSAFAAGVHDAVHEPLGRGPGTAGPASVYNTGHPARIAENYFLQIAQEVGLIGLALFLVINVLVARTLWACRRDMLAFGVLVALVSVTIINLLSHAWADDTLTYLWWGLAAIALAQFPDTGAAIRGAQKHGGAKVS